VLEIKTKWRSYGLKPVAPPQLEWPRTIRTTFSDATTTHPGTGVMGRGTDEMKTNDVEELIRADLGISINISGLILLRTKKWKP
jgi:hypothetical protein